MSGRIHAHLRPALILQRRFSLGNSFLLCDRLPITLDHSDGGLGLARSNRQCSLLYRTKRWLSNRCHRVIANRLAGIEVLLLLVDRDSPHAVVGVGRDVQPQTNWVALFQLLPRGVDALSLIRRERPLQVCRGSRRRNICVRRHRLERLDPFVVLLFGNSALNNALG